MKGTKGTRTYITGPRTQPEDYPRGPLHQAARFLYDRSRDFMKDKASVAEVDEAVKVWQDAVREKHGK